jgi:hypothetical protein
MNGNLSQSVTDKGEDSVPFREWARPGLVRSMWISALRYERRMETKGGFQTGIPTSADDFMWYTYYLFCQRLDQEGNEIRG